MIYLMALYKEVSSVQSSVVVQWLDRFSPRYFCFIPVVFTNLSFPLRCVTHCNILHSVLT
jgi:hypothetical protein